MRIEKMTLVTLPKENSVLEDICFEVDMEGLSRQFKGGLNSSEILRTYTDHEEAIKYAKTIIKSQKNYKKLKGI